MDECNCDTETGIPLQTFSKRFLTVQCLCDCDACLNNKHNEHLGD